MSSKFRKVIYSMVAFAMVLGSSLAFSAPKALAADATYDYELITQSPYPATLAPGATTNVWIEVKNTGTATWTRDGVGAPLTTRLGSGSAYGNANQQRDYSSEFANSDWLSPNRPVAILHPEVRPGWHTRFQFNIKAPTTNGTYKAYFTPVVDGVSWMKDIGIYWQLSVSGGTTPPPVVPGTSLNVALSASSPAAGTIIEGSLTDLAKFTFTNNEATARKITSIKFKRTGVSADATLSNVYLYNGGNRITDAASVSDGYVNFNNSAGVFSIAANTATTITVKAQIATSTSGQTVGVAINAAGDITSDAATVNGTFPISGANMSIASATLATVALNATTTPATTSIDPVNDYTVWQNVVTIGNRAVNLKYLRLKEIGSVTVDSLVNFRLYADGIQIASATGLDSDFNVSFDLTSNPKRLEAGSRTLKVVADVMDGSSRNFSFSLRTSSDIMVSDVEYNADLVATGVPASTGTISVNAGTLLITKATDSASSNVAVSASNTALAKFKLEARGENVKVDSLRLTYAATQVLTGSIDPAASTTVTGVGTLFTTELVVGDTITVTGETRTITAIASATSLTVSVAFSDNANDTSVEATSNNLGKLRNGRLYLGGVQIGSTADINEDSQSTAYTTFNLGSSLIVMPNTPAYVEVKADIYDNDGTNNVSATDTLQVSLVGGDLNNAQAQTSFTIIDAPATSVAANQLTVASGSLSVAKYGAYGDQTIVAPQTAYKVGSFVLTTGSSEAVDINTVEVDFTTADAADASDDLTNLKIVYGSITSAIKSTITDADNSFSVSARLEPSSSMTIDVYSDVASSATDGDGTADTIVAAITVTGSGVITSNTLYADTDTSDTAKNAGVSGQTITAVSSGTVTTSLASSSPLAQITYGGQSNFVAAKYRFSGTYDTFTIKELTLTLDDATAASAVSAIGATSGSSCSGVATYPVGGTGVTLSGLNIPIAANSYADVTVCYTLNTIGSGAGASGDDVNIMLDAYKYTNSQGVETSDTNDDLNSNAIIVYKSMPTISKVTLSDLTDLINGSAKDVYKFSVMASGGDVALKQIKLGVAWNDDITTADDLELESLKFYRDGTEITSLVNMTDEDGNSVESTSGLLETDDTLVVYFISEEVVPTGSTYTYTVKATPQDFNDDNADSVSLSMNSDAIATAAHTYLADTDANAVEIIAGLTDSLVAGAEAANFIWSDKSALSHLDTITDNDAGAADSTADWYNGYLAKNLALDGQTWQK